MDLRDFVSVDNLVRQLHIAASDGEVAKVVELCNWHRDLKALRMDENGDTVLHWASANGHDEVIRKLRELAADWPTLLHAQNEQKSTPLHKASEAGHEAVARLLIECSSNWSALLGTQAANDQATPMEVAAWCGHEAVARVISQFLQDRLAGRDGRNIAELSFEEQQIRLQAACSRGDVEDFCALCNLINDQPENFHAMLTRTNCSLHFASLTGRAVDLSVLKEFAYTPKLLAWTVLHFAAAEGHAAVVRLLHEQAPDWEELAFKETGVGDTALHLAAMRGHEAVVRALHELAAAVLAILQSRPNRQGNLALHGASMCGHATMVRVLWELAPNRAAFLRAPGQMGSPAVHLASGSGHEATVRMLHALTPNEAWVALVGKQTQFQCTALHLACWSQSQANDAVVRMLCESVPNSQALVHAADVQGMTALHVASQHGHAKAIRILHEFSPDWAALVDARLTCNYGRDRRTALHFASGFGHEAVIRVLRELTIDWPALLHAVTGLGDTALHLASFGGHEACVRVLHALAPEDWSRLLGARNGLQNQALHYACCRESGHAAIIKVLCELAPDLASFLSAPGHNGNSAVHIACEEGQKEVVRMLSELAPDLHALLHSVCEGHSPLHVASKTGHAEIVYTLHDFSPDWAALLEMRNGEGRTALECADFSGHDSVVAAIQELALR